jgi:mRNA-degrading endonuclease RelE of RelBE toxin-antitoxin system
MFRIVFKPSAIQRLKRMRRFDAVVIVDSIERHLSVEPERATRGSIKRLRGRQATTYRLRVRDYRVFYDVIDDRVDVVQILHKSETTSFYRKEEP